VCVLFFVFLVSDWVIDNGTQNFPADLYPRSSVARSLGLRTCFGFPIFRKRSDPDGLCHGVLMFYSTSMVEASPLILSFVTESVKGIFYPEDAPVPMIYQPPMNGYSIDSSTPQLSMHAMQPMLQYPFLYNQSGTKVGY
jgi:hypothetical protein